MRALCCEKALCLPTRQKHTHTHTQRSRRKHEDAKMAPLRSKWDLLSRVHVHHPAKPPQDFGSAMAEPPHTHVYKCTPPLLRSAVRHPPEAFYQLPFAHRVNEHIRGIIGARHFMVAALTSEPTLTLNVLMEAEFNNPNAPQCSDLMCLCPHVVSTATAPNSFLASPQGTRHRKQT